MNIVDSSGEENYNIQEEDNGLHHGTEVIKYIFHPWLTLDVVQIVAVDS